MKSLTKMSRKARKQLSRALILLAICVCGASAWAADSPAELVTSEIQARVAELYASPEVARSLLLGEIPEKHQGTIEPFMNGDTYRSYQSRSERIEWGFYWDTPTSELAGDTLKAYLSLRHRVNSDGTLTYMYDPFDAAKGASLSYDDCDVAWRLTVAADRVAATLEEFVALAANTTGVWGELEGDAKAAQEAVCGAIVRKWETEFPLASRALNTGYPIPCLEADYAAGTYCASLDFELHPDCNEYADYALTAAQFGEALALLEPLATHLRTEALMGYLRSRQLPPSRIYEMYGGSEEDFCWLQESPAIDGDDAVYFLRYNDEYDAIIGLTQAEFNALAFEWWPLDQPARFAAMRETYERLAAEGRCADE